MATLLTRLLLVGLLVLTLADLKFHGTTSRQAVVVAVDRSLSTEGSRATADAFCRDVLQHADGNHVAFLPFAARPGSVTRDWPSDSSGLDPMASDLGAAVDTSRAQLPAEYVPQIVLLTDGNQTRGDVLAAARGAGVPISVVPLESRATRGNVRVSATVHVGPPRVLLVEGQPEAGARLAGALRQAKIDIDRSPPQGVPSRLDALCRYDAVVLVNVPATLLAQAAVEGIRHYVRDSGGGLLVVGGDQAFTPGGYTKTALEEILPVASISKEKPHKPELAMVLVIDRSESMGGKRIDLAKAAMRRAVELLGPNDQVGVIAFEDESAWACPLHACSDKQHVLAQIASIQAEGRTNLAPAMEKAYLALREAYADLKHIIVLTDGLSHTADFTSIARRVAADGITLSTLGIGDEVAGPVLEELARIGKGRYYYCADVAALPTIFALETASASKRGVTEGPFFAQKPLPQAGAWQPSAAQSQRVARDDSLPALLGYDETQAKPGSQVTLVTPAGEPLWARWQAGRGKVAAFTSDVENHWAAAWLRWPGFEPFWGDAIRSVLRNRPSAPAVEHKPADPPEEMRRRPANAALLREVAKVTGGRYDPSAAAIFAPSGRTAPWTKSLWPLFLAVAMAIFVLDVGMKRWTVSGGR